MLEIRPLQEDSDKVDACEACSVQFDPDKFYYGAYTDNTLVGLSVFVIKEDCGVITELLNTTASDDKDALFVAGRATLNFIDLCGVHTVVYNGEDIALAKRIGFKQENGMFTVDTTKLFSEHCS